MPKIFVGNLHVESTPDNETELRALFEQFGTVSECSILTGKSFGFVVSIAVLKGLCTLISGAIQGFQILTWESWWLATILSNVRTLFTVI